MLGFVGFRVYRSRLLPVRETVSVAEKHSHTHDAFTGAHAPASDPEIRAITASLDQLNAAMLKQDAAAISRVLDCERLGDELERLGAFDSLSISDKNKFVSGMRSGMLRTMIAQSPSACWSAHKVKKVVLSDDGREAVVYDLQSRGVGADNYLVKMRYWVRNTGAQWRIWDFEALEVGIRSSTAMASATLSAGPQMNPNSPALLAGPQLSAATKAIRMQDWPKAEASLKNLDALALPPNLAAPVKMFWAMVCFRQGQYGDALKYCDLTEATGQDVPMVNEIRTHAYNALGRYDEALQSARKWEDALGGDRELYYAMGTALVHLKRPGEAADAFSKSLDEDPEGSGCLAELCKALPPGKKAEVGRRFGQCHNPHQVFVTVIRIVEKARDLEGMQTLLDAYRTRTESANDPWLTYYDAELKVLHKEYAKAEAELKSLLPQSTAQGQEIFASEYLHSARLAGHALEAYGNAPDKTAAFKILATRLQTDGDRQTLRRLVAVHLNQFPRDPWGHFYDAGLHRDAGEYETADIAYAKAMSFADPANNDAYRTARVCTRFKAGKGLSAYHDIAPCEKVFNQLAALYSGGTRPEDLARLVAARRADAPNDPELPLWDADAKFLAQDYAGAIGLLQGHRPSADKRAVTRHKWVNIFIRSQVRLQHFESALKEAYISEPAGENWYYIAIAECAAGNVAQGTRALDAFLQDDGDAEIAELYADADLGPALAAATFANWRARHPNTAATQPATRPAHPSVTPDTN